jgi:hypothetical protein
LQVIRQIARAVRGGDQQPDPVSREIFQQRSVQRLCRKARIFQLLSQMFRYIFRTAQGAAADRVMSAIDRSLR